MIATRTVQAKHGTFIYHSQDRFLGTSLRLYGEYSEGEVFMYDDLLKETDTVIEVGANIGALTVPLARRVKKVIAFEPQPENYELLRRNLIGNDIINVDAYPYALGSKKDTVNIQTLEELDIDHGIVGDYGGFEIGVGSHSVEQCSLDDMPFSKISFIKMDCEGSELEVLKGAEKLITNDWPMLYIENNRPHKSKALVNWLVNHKYDCYWHRPRYFREDNFLKYNDNIFGDCDSPNMLCLHNHKIDSKWLMEKVE